MSAPRVAAIIAAAGSGERLGADLPKALVQLGGRTLVEHAFAHLSPTVSEIVIAVPAEYQKEFESLFGESARIVVGGSTRSSSIQAALKEISSDIEFILVHDAARALASSSLAERVINELVNGERAVIPVLPVADTIKRIDAQGYVVETPDRQMLRAVQTPQGFAASVLRQAHASEGDATDDAGLVERMGIPVKTIDGEVQAMKITTKDDLALAQRLLIGNDATNIRVGIGTDTHAFGSEGKLALAALMWEEEPALAGHSDGDVAAHAICDALFSAAMLGDLGSNFGVDDPAFAGASGARLLKETHARINNAGYSIINVAVQIVGNRPKIAPRRSAAIAALASALGGAEVSVTATTTDGLGFTGEGKGLSAIATAVLVKK
jgi:2-C-methyl-D-erythritol 4-phosphate cytidylyltransferase / 2-C-methyl-D-erythritol 2,4-cyclodiphosphate synthase